MKALKSILVVDDEPGFHELFRFHLETLGFVIDSAFDGTQGLECFQKRPYDLVFSDVHMPKMKGSELLQKIKEINPEQRVVIMNSFSDPEAGFEQKMQESGAVTCLYKPFEIDQLMAVLDQAMGVAQ